MAKEGRAPPCMMVVENIKYYILGGNYENEG